VNAAGRLLLWAQLAFWGCVVVCFAVAGGGLGDNHGFSVYGGRVSTIVPWAVGFLATAGLTVRAAALLGESDPALARALRVNVLLLFFVLLTPDTVNQFFYVAHIVASIALFLFQAVVGLWLVQRTGSRAVLQLYVVQIAGGVIAGLSQLQWIGLLSPGILVFQVFFGALLVAATTDAHPALEAA
jgi:hypothetical protein